MACVDCATVIKRGYLVDKKGGLLDRNKKWFVLRQDITQGYCVLEYFKDEKSASKREPPKGFINVRDIVEVERVPDKKQTFELLCPGVAHRLMANSEAEADDWAAALRQLIVYRKGDLQTLSLQRIMSQGGNTSPLSSSPPSAPMVTSTFSSPLPHPLMIPPNTHTVSTDAQSRSPHIHHTFPTPPESIVTTMPAVVSTQQPHVLQKQGSHDGINPYPSPPSSSDGSSVCGDRSSTSFDSVSVIDGVDSDFFLKSRFRVTVKDNEKLNIFGECDLFINDDSLTLCNVSTGQQIISWSLGAVRRYGVNNVCFTFDSGRYCNTGEGKFYFYSHQSRQIHNRVHFAITKMNANKDNKEHRRSSAPDTMMNRPMMSPKGFNTACDFVSSPPQYNHIEHFLKPSLSHETYNKIRQPFPSQEYEKLNHNSHLMHSNTVPLFNAKPVNYTTILHDTQEPIYSTLKEEDGETATDMDETISVVSDDPPPPIPPPPIPPRLCKMTSI